MDVVFYRFEAFFADDVLHTAGVVGGNGRSDTERDQPIGNKRVAFVYLFRDFSAGFKQRDEAARIHLDISVFSEVFHGNTNAWFGIIELIYDVDGTDRTVSFLEDQYCFQIIFGGFHYFHDFTLFRKIGIFYEVYHNKIKYSINFL